MDELDIDGFTSSMMNGKGWISFMSTLQARLHE
jgi:hypothetical protein